MSRRNNARVVPWATHSEWEQTYHWLYAHRIEGVRRVRGWASRGKVPQAVDATAMFVEIWLRDRSGTLSEHELRLMYSIAFVRFVNGVVDAQQKGVYAGSVAGIAESLGLPGWFVDLRHSGTHDRLPSISLLRSGCHQALDWLNANYWIVQTTYLNNTASDVQELLVSYTNAVSNSDSKTASNSIKEIISIILADSYRDFLIPILISPGFLVPESKKMRSKYSDLTLNAEVQNMWSEPINAFETAWPGFIEDILLAIIATFIDPSRAAETVGVDSFKGVAHGSMSFQSTLASWAKYILKNKVLGNPVMTTPQGSGDENCTLDNIVEACLGNPNIFTKHILTDIASFNADISLYLTPFIAFVDDSFKVSVMAESTTPRKRKHHKVSSSAQDLSPSSLLDELNILRTRLKEIQYEDSVVPPPESLTAAAAAPSSPSQAVIESPWKLATDLSWHRVPLGHIPGVGLPFLDLSIDVDDSEVARLSGVVNIPALDSLDGNGMFEIRETDEVDGDDVVVGVDVAAGVGNRNTKLEQVSTALKITWDGLRKEDVKQISKKIRLF